MKYSFKLGNYISQNYGGPDINALLNLSPEELTEKLNSQVGALEELQYLGTAYNGVFVAEIKKVEPHPDADKLRIVKIDDGEVAHGLPRDEDGWVQVVCGAPNVKVGMFVAWISPGSIVPSAIKDDKPFELTSLKLRGVTSNGMLASERELDFSDDHSGILDLQGYNSELTFKPGDRLVDALDLSDVIADFENKMFTHRPDCFGHLGIAREIAAIQGLKFKSPDWYLKSKTLPELDSNENTKLKVSLRTPACSKYRATIIEDVRVAPSPKWMQSLFAGLGLSSINNLVDITNYMMILTAQPQHAFDLDKLKKITGSDEVEIVIRNAHEGEELALLNGKTIKLNVDDVVIALPEKPIALAGVMGGSETEVDENTKNILLETAAFDMYAVRRTSMRHGLFTDAVTRYTKGQPASQIDAVAAKTAEEYKKLAHGKITLSLSEDQDVKLPEPLTLSVTKLNDVLGSSFKVSGVQEILERVEVQAKSKSGDELEVQPPFWRTDLEIPEDLIEEVGRIYGFNKLPASLQKRAIQPARINKMIKLKGEIRNYLASLGANEVLNYSFVHGKLFDAANQNKDLAFKIRNALSPDLQYYRLSLAPSLLAQVHKNIKDGFDAFAMFEIGKVHIKGHPDAEDDQVPAEMSRLSLVFADKNGSAEDAYYRAANYLKQLLGHLNVKFNLVRTDKEFFGDKIPVTAPFSHVNSATIFINEKPSGIIGSINPATATKLKLPGGSAVLEIDLHGLSEIFNIDANYKPLSKFPSVHQDVTVEVASGAIFSFVEQKLENILAESGLDYNYQIVSIYQASEDAPTKKITFGISLNNPKGTLTKQEANAVIDSISSALDKK
jgi:phenylalanyl-tRNA synthetase beta chain